MGTSIQNRTKVVVASDSPLNSGYGLTPVGGTPAGIRFRSVGMGIFGPAIVIESECVPKDEIIVTMQGKINVPKTAVSTVSQRLVKNDAEHAHASRLTMLTMI